MRVKKGNLFFLITLIFLTLFSVVISELYDKVAFFGNMMENSSISTSIMFFEILSIAIPIIFYFIITKDKFFDVVKIKKVSFKNVLFIIGISFAIQPMMMFLSAFGTLFSPNHVSEVATELTKDPFLIALFAIAVIPAVLEELMMRGIVLFNYKNISVFKAALVNGLFFGILHQNMQQFFYAALLGFIFTYFVRYTGSILSSILAHFIINGTQISFSYLISVDNVDNFESAVPTLKDIMLGILAFGIIAIPFTALSLILLIKFIEHNKNSCECTIEEQDTKCASTEITNEKIVDLPFFIIIISVLTGMMLGIILTLLDY